MATKKYEVKCKCEEVTWPNPNQVLIKSNLALGVKEESSF